MAKPANPTKSQFGVVGLGVMGANLALNVEEHGYSVAVYNRDFGKTEEFLAQNRGKKLVGVKTYEELARSLDTPRRILLMVKAGDAVDQVMGALAPFLQPKDIVIDGGNSFFEDTRRREKAWRDKGLSFFGCGVSGGEEGARHGPSLMPGGDRAAFEHLKPILEAIAAKTASGPCVTYCGPDGAGHFVKMVHNGIEYGDMQLIAEAYDVLRKGLGLSAAELAPVFEQWNKGPLDSFLIEITAKIFRHLDAETKKPLVDLVLDKAGQKGTGKWTAETALDLGVPVPTIAAAIDARVISSMRDEREKASKALSGPPAKKLAGAREEWTAAIHDALYAAKIGAYAQGMSLLRAASQHYEWGIDLSELARIWTGGCIIRARFLDVIRKAFQKDPDLANLLLDADFKAALQKAQAGLRKVVAAAAELGIPLPAMGASLAYYDSYRAASLPQNLTQAQRDLFGAHTFERVDHPERGFVHEEWLK